MHYVKTKLATGLVVLLAVAGFALASMPGIQANDDNRAPELPSPICDELQVPPENIVAFHAYALGVQIYRWDGDSWEFVAPEATLYADANFRGKVATHFAGPTWKSNSGSNVVAGNAKSCIPDATAIPWLRLNKVSTEGPGIFSEVSFVQRVNTAGGLAPTTPGSFVGEEKKVPYTAEYIFYRLPKPEEN
jgi:hypothetical protein